jgi:carboxymethylenebutenolidase
MLAAIYTTERRTKMGAEVTFASEAGSKLAGYVSEPGGTGKAGGVVVIQEWWGVNDHIKSVCDRFAQAGFVGIAPDLYHGKRPATKEEAATMMRELDTKRAVAEIGETAAYLESVPRCNGKVAVVGFCLGGALALAASRHVDGLAAVVAFYGIPALPLDEYTKVTVPIQAHFAKKDDWAKASVAEEIQQRVRSGGGRMDLFVYDAGHAFMRATDPQVHDAASARLAWERTVEFFGKHLHR